MLVELRERTPSHVATYFTKTRDAEIQRLCPQKAQTVEEALADYARSLLPGTSSYGRTIYMDGEYVGDIWCYCMDKADDPQAMLSYCIFEKQCWGKGIATAAVRLFLQEVRQKYDLSVIGAFTFCSNMASVRVLEKTGFRLIELFEEDGVQSAYFESREEIGNPF